MPFFIPKYDQLLIHDMMLSDNTRNDTYRRALEANIKPGDVVIDVGAGTGLLSLFAARAGAKKVYAIEPTDTIRLARRIAKANNLDDKIEFINTRIEDAQIPEPADIIVSEWLGVFALQENMLPSIANARDRFLKPGGKLLPSRVELYLALLENQTIFDQKISRWQNDFFGLDYSDFAQAYANEVHSLPIAPDSLISSPNCIADIDIHTAQDSRLTVETSFTASRTGTCHGLAGWFSAHFPRDIVLDTTPDKPETHWGQCYFPIRQPVIINTGVQLKLNLVVHPVGDLAHFSWELAFPGTPTQIRRGDTRNSLLKEE